ncbi:MAG: hypothetical protein WCW44_03370 [archaeon]|jgi:DNA-binding MarR family transcriptional regulator
MPLHLPPAQMNALKKKAADFASQKRLVPFSQLRREFVSSTGLPVSQPWMSTAIKLHHGVSFEQMQREARSNFILQNADKSNAWLAKRLGVSEKGITRLTRLLKKEGKLKASKRYAQTKLEQTQKLPLAYVASAHNVARFLHWSPLTRGLSIIELSSALQVPKKTVDYAVRSLRDLGFVNQIAKQERRGVFVLTQKGVEWLRKMEEKRNQRDAKLVKTGAIKSVIKRKQQEKERLIWSTQYLQSKGLEFNIRAIQRRLHEMEIEIIGLRREMDQRRMN